MSGAVKNMRFRGASQDVLPRRLRRGFARFYEGYRLRTKFGYHKRPPHCSSVILTGQLTGDEALAGISKPAYDEATIARDFEWFAAKLDLSIAE